jgi:pseudomonalisin/xanthomonalisin
VRVARLLGWTLAVGATIGWAGSGVAAAATPVAGSGPLILSGASDEGLAPAQTRSITLVLASSDASGLASFLASRNHPALSLAQSVARFGPAASTVAAVESWAASAGLRVVSVSPDRELVRLSGSTTTLGRALGVSFHEFLDGNGSSFVSSVGTASLPSGVAAATAAILGLSDLGKVQPATVYRAGLGGLPVATTSYGPPDFYSLYDAPSNETGAGQELSVIAEGDLSQVRTDLVDFEGDYHLPRVAFNEIDLGPPSTDTSGADEYDLDTQYSTAMAPGVSQVNVYDAVSLADSDTVTAVDRWITDGLSSQASFSAGECELLAETDGFVSGLDAVLATGAAQGKSLFVSSGDTGSQCPALLAENGLPLGIPGVDYPASSGSAIGVGGTTILSSTPLLGLGAVLGSGPTEIGWYAGGGGTSLFEATPSWQAGVGGSFLGIRRGVPDVSLDADPDSGYNVVISGVLTSGVGGTSASAPSWQGIWARAEAAHGGTLGFAGPVIYKDEPSSAFRDITVGTNTLFPATSGWDYVTGRGVPNIAAFVSGA